MGYLIDIAVNEGYMEKSGAFYGYKNEKLGQGRENAKAFLSENPTVANEIEAMIRKKYFEVDSESAKTKQEGPEKETEKTRSGKK